MENNKETYIEIEINKRISIRERKLRMIKDYYIKYQEYLKQNNNKEKE